MTQPHLNGNGAPAPVLPFGAITLAADPERPPVSPASSGLQLTGKGIAYAHAHAPVTREAIEASIEQHLALVQTLIAWLDDLDGDCDLEPSLGWNPYGHHDLEGGDVNDEEEAVDEDGGNILDEPHDGDLDQWEGDGREDMEPDYRDWPTELPPRWQGALG